MGRTVRVLNVDKLAAKLIKMGKIDLTEPTKSGSYRTENRAKGFAPVDTGLLKRSIKNDVKRVATGWEGKISTNVEYALFQEKGTSANPQGQPFLRPGLKASRAEILSDYRNYIRKELLKYRK